MNLRGANSRETVTAAEVQVALSNMYRGSAWAFLAQVKSATAYRRMRTADALAMSVWPSRGLHLYGFEIKVNRNDWLNELRQPEKADEICAFCDFWYVVIGETWVAKQSELPPTWGLIAPIRKGVLSIVREAPKLDAKPIDTLLLASILRNVSRATVSRSEIAAELAAARQSGIDESKRTVERAKQREAEAFKIITDFETASGIKLNEWEAGKIGEALGLLLHSDLPRFKLLLESFQKSCSEVSSKLDATVAEVEAINQTARRQHARNKQST